MTSPPKHPEASRHRREDGANVRVDVHILYVMYVVKRTYCICTPYNFLPHYHNSLSFLNTGLLQKGDSSQDGLHKSSKLLNYVCSISSLTVASVQCLSAHDELLGGKRQVGPKSIWHFLLGGYSLRLFSMYECSSNVSRNTVYQRKHTCQILQTKRNFMWMIMDKSTVKVTLRTFWKIDKFGFCSFLLARALKTIWFVSCLLPPNILFLFSPFYNFQLNFLILG